MWIFYEGLHQKKNLYPLGIGNVNNYLGRKVILNKDFQQWGAYDYSEKLNVLETSVPVLKAAEKQEWFEIQIEPIDGRNANLILSWDTTRVVVPIKEAKPEVTTKIIEKLSDIKKIEREASK